jgi:hypothetical protein
MHSSLVVTAGGTETALPLSPTAGARSDLDGLPRSMQTSRQASLSETALPGYLRQSRSTGSDGPPLLVWNDSACPTTARELPQRTPAIVPQQESERSGIDGRRLLLSALSRARGVRDEMPVRQRRQVCVGGCERSSTAPSRLNQARHQGCPIAARAAMSAAGIAPVLVGESDGSRRLLDPIRVARSASARRQQPRRRPGVRVHAKGQVSRELRLAGPCVHGSGGR